MRGIIDIIHLVNTLNLKILNNIGISFHGEAEIEFVDDSIVKKATTINLGQ